MELPEAHAAALDSTATIVAAVSDDQWDDSTPCADWTVRELVDHLVSGNLWVVPLVDGQTIESVGDRYDGDLLGSDPAGAYDRSAVAASASFRVPGAMDAPCSLSYGVVPGSVYCGHRFIDVFIHGWDLATATEQSTVLPADLVDTCAEVVAPQAELLASSGAFGTEVTVANGDAQARLLALLGRQT